MTVALTDRQQYILACTVRHYIATAEPVGSKALAEIYNLKVSPATIRSCLGVLEKIGLLYQPHTSAGRVPSDSGYRIYVDQLQPDHETIGRQLDRLIREYSINQDTRFEEIIRGAAQILSILSGYITLITLPQSYSSLVRHLQLIQVQPGKVMLILVTSDYETQSLLVGLPENVAEQDEELVDHTLQVLSNFLLQQLRGQPILHLSSLDWQELDRQFSQYVDWLRRLLAQLERPRPTPMVINGVATALKQPEFSELQQVQTLLYLLEQEQAQLWPLIFDLPQEQPRRAKVVIGSENPLEPMRSCALIAATYQQGEVPVGSVGVIGPTRMEYDKAIALVEAIADYLSTSLS